jgi:signal transduction histidine kinase/ActR/RegA family two-component response regulator
MRGGRKGIWIVPVCALIVLLVGAVQMRFVLKVSAPLVAYFVPLLVGGFFGFLLWRILRLGEQLKASVRDLERSSTEVANLNKRLSGIVDEKSQALDKSEAHLQHAQRLDALGRLAGGVAHDFNNLLTAIITGTSLVQSRSDDEVDRNVLADVLAAANHGAELTGQLLAFGRREEGEDKAEVIKVEQQVEQTLPMLRRLIGDAVEIDWQPGVGVPPICMSGRQLVQVLMNLVLNARDAMPTGGVVFLSTAVQSSPDGDRVHLRVEDSGLGMDEATIERALEPFFTTKELGRGTGLGLSVAFGIVRAAGGDIRLESRLGAGTTAIVEWPAAAQVPALDPEVALAGEGRNHAGTRPTILVIEDDDLVRRTIELSLSDSGYQVVMASGSAEARQALSLHQGAVDLLLCDIMLAGENGIEVAASIRSLIADAPVLFMTGYADSESATRAGELLQKPFSVETLLSAIARALPPTTQRGEGADLGQFSSTGDKTNRSSRP